MSKILIVFTLGLTGFLSTGVLAQDQIFMMKTYAAKLEAKSGQVTIDSEGFKVLELPLMTFNDQKDGKHTRIWPPRSGCSPQIKVTQEGQNTHIHISYNKPGLVQSFEKTILLMPRSISVEVKMVPFRTFYSCSSGLKLLPQVFDGATYTGINQKKQVSGILPQGIPTKQKFVWNGLGRLTEITFTNTKIGTVAFEFDKKSPRGLSDFRAVDWSKKYNLHYFKINYPSGKKFQYAATIQITRDNQAAQKTASTKLAPAQILFDLDFNNGFNAKAKGNGHVQNKNTPQLTKGIKGQAAQFGSHTVLKYLEAKNLDKEKGSLSFWVKAKDILDPYDETHNQRTIFTESGKSTSGSNVFKLWKSTWGGLRFDLRNKKNDFWGVYDFYNWKNDQWHHVTLTWNHKNGIAIYVDGSLKQSAQQHKQKRGLLPTQWLPIAAKEFFFGAINSQGDAPWRGALDEIRIFDRDLTPSEIQKEYERFAYQKLKVFTYDQYLFAQVTETCHVILENHSDQALTVTPEFVVTNTQGEIISNLRIRKKTIKKHDRITLDFPLNLPSPGDYNLQVTYGKHTHSLALKALPQKENIHAGGKLDLELIKTLDLANPSKGDLISDGNNIVVKSPIGQYRETGTKLHDRFAVGFELPQINVPYLAVVTWPDNAKRSMEILLHSERGKQSYQAPGGIFTGDAFTPSGKMKEYQVIFWPRTKKSAFIIMCLENNYPAAVKDIKIYRIKSDLPKLPVAPFVGNVPARHLGIFYEDPVIPMCFGGGSLFPGFEQSTDRLLNYMQWFGQDLLSYPIVWYHGPLYGSEAEPIVANRGVRMHPENFPKYLLKRLEARGMKFRADLNIGRLESLDQMALIDEQRVFKGEETIANMRYDNHLQLTTPWNTQETRYNNLDPRVQEAVKKIVQEIMDRYGDSPAFSGIMLFAKHTGLFRLGTLHGGYNDINLTRFQKDTGITIPTYDHKDIYRFAKSYQWLVDNEHAWEQWISWRCKMLYQYYKELAEIVTTKRKDAKLSVFCLEGSDVIFSESAKYRNNTFSKNTLLRETGIDLDLFAGNPDIEIVTVKRTNKMQHRRRLHGPEMGIEAHRSHNLIPELAADYQNIPHVSTVLFDAYFEDTVGHANPLKDLKKILPKTTEAGWRCSAINTNTFYALENYVASLNNLDSLSITKGGFAIGTLGIEPWVGRFAQAYRTLPAVKFDDIPNIVDPVRVRQKVVDGKNYFYVLNRLPVEVTFTWTLSGNGPIKDLVNSQIFNATKIVLEPYGLRTFLAPANVKVVAGTSVVPSRFMNNLKAMLKTTEKNGAQLQANGVNMTTYNKFLAAGKQYVKENKSARLYILMYEPWVNDIERLLANSDLQGFLNVDQGYLKKQNRKRYGTAIKRTSSIEIDGVLNDKDWENAEVIDDFADFMDFNGKFLAKPASQKTQVRFLYDNEKIYLGITCEEPNTDRIIIKKGLKDAPLWANDSSVEFFLKDHKAPKGAFAQLLVNAGSSKTDIFGGTSERGWNINWQAQSKIIPGKGWVCEIAIPLKEIGYLKNHKILFNMARHRGKRPLSGLSLTEGKGKLFCEEFWLELSFK